jgi:hypothetical protein
MAKERKQYTKASKIGTLRILEKNDFNYLQTQNLTGVSRSTIKNWEKELGAEVFSGMTPTEKALKEVDAEMTKQDKKIMQKYFNLRMQILNRIALLVPHETRLDPLINTLKAISEELDLMDKEGENGSNTTGFIKIITDQLQLKKQEGKLPW